MTGLEGEEADMAIGPWSMKSEHGYALDELMSAIQKCIRRGQVEEAVFFVSEANESGYGGWVWRRLFIITSEDVGLADPLAPAVIGGLWTMSEVLRANLRARQRAEKATQTYPSLPLLQAVWYLARAAKNRELADMDTLLVLRRTRGQLIPIPEFAKDQHTAAGRVAGKGLYHFDGGTGPEFGRHVTNEVEVDGNQWQRRFYEEWKPDLDHPSKRTLE